MPRPPQFSAAQVAESAAAHRLPAMDAGLQAGVSRTAR